MNAYEWLVRKHQEVAFRTACLITDDTSEAEDAAQEAFVKAYRALNKFHPGASFRPWLLAIVANEARNRRKAAGRRAGLALRASDEPVSSAAPSSPEATVVEAERRSELLQTLSTLQDAERMVISCRYFLELSEAETAAALDCPRGTVKSRLSRALKRLREIMKEEKDAG